MALAPHLVPTYIEALRPYEPGRNADEVRQAYGLARVVKLASNENPLGPSPLAINAIQARLQSIHLYPQAGLSLRQALAERYRVKMENVIVGSDNVITLRTFSKVYGLAGLRVGYGFAHETLIRNLLKVKLPFEPGVLAETAAVAALRDEAFVSRSLEVNARGLRFVETALVERGFSIVPSQANFTMVVFAAPASAAEFVERLLRTGVIVRPLASFGLPCCVRISIGTEEQNRILIDAIDRREAPGLLVSAPNGKKMAKQSLPI